MNPQRLVIIVVTLSLMVAAAFTIRTAVATSTVASIGHGDYDEVEQGGVDLGKAPANPVTHPAIVPPAVSSPPQDPAGYFNVVSAASRDGVRGSGRPPELYFRVQAPDRAGYWNAVFQGRASK